MKSSLLKFLFLFLIILGCDKFKNTPAEKTIENKLSKNEFLITGACFTPDIQSIYLYKIENDSIILTDSSQVQSNKFTFKGNIESPKKYILKTNSDSEMEYRFIADASEMTILLNDFLPNSNIYSSSDFQTNLKDYQNKKRVFDLKEIELLNTLKKNINHKTTATFKANLERVLKDRNEFIFDYITAHTSSYVSPIILHENFKTLSSKSFQVLYDTLAQPFKELAYLKKIKKNLIVADEKITENTKSKSEKKKAPAYRTNARPISGPSPNGNIISLASIPRGKVILVDFWASWCGPCRMTNPQLVYLYKKYKSKGLVILSVSEDKSTANWISAIAKDNLTWDTHLLDKNNLIASSYGASSIPHKVLLDKQGRIADWKISGNKLEKRIQELLNE